MNDLITLVVYLFVGGAVLYLLQLILAMFPWPAPLKTAILVLVALLILLWMLRALGFWL